MNHLPQLPQLDNSNYAPWYIALESYATSIDASVVIWVFAGVHKKHQTHNHKRPSRGDKCLGYLCKEKGEAW